MPASERTGMHACSLGHMHKTLCHLLTNQVMWNMLLHIAMLGMLSHCNQRG